MIEELSVLGQLLTNGLRHAETVYVVRIALFALEFAHLQDSR